MNKINMVDLKSQYLKIKDEVDSSIMNVIDSTAFINGPAVRSFQANLEKYLGVKHVIPVGNGTDALQIALMALNLKPGDEVITASFTFIATAEVIALLGLTPVLVDVDEDTFNINVEAIEKAITPKTKAIVPVHLFGQCADMEGIMRLAKKYNLTVVEDACQAIGADFRFSDGKMEKAGTIGTIGCTSFFPSKNLGCYGDGGAIFTNDDALAEKMRGICNHGMFVRYYHELVGVNSRLDSIQAAILDIKLRHLDEYSKARGMAAEYYNEALKNCDKIETPTIAEYTNHVFHQYTLKLKGVDRAKLQKFLEERGIPAMIYYPVPVHLQEAYRGYGYSEGSLPATERLCGCVISLPMHTELDKEQLKFITDSVLEGVQ